MNIYLLKNYFLFIVLLHAAFGVLKNEVASLSFHNAKSGVSQRLFHHSAVKPVHGNAQMICSSTAGPSLALEKQKSQSKDVLSILAASFCVAALMYPLDLIRALKMANAGSSLTTTQLLTNFKNAHGLQGFITQGLAPELLRSTWMRFIKFSLFPMVHFAISNGLTVEKGSSITKACAAFIGSVPEVISIMPLEIAKIVLQLDTKNIYKNNMITAMTSIVKERGLSGLAIGYFGVQMRQAIWSAAYFASIEMFEKRVNNLIEIASFGKLNSKSNKSTRVFSQLLAGFLAGVFGAALNTPFDTIRSTLQKQVLGSSVVSATFLSTSSAILASKGLGGLYTGFGFKALHLGGGGALMAFFVPFFKNLFNNI